MRYALADIEITDPEAEIRVAGDESGAGVVVRYRDCPIAFFLMTAAPGVIRDSALRQLLIAEAGTELTAELLSRELNVHIPAGSVPGVTAAICTHNHPDLTARAIQSLLASASNAGSDLDVLVVDNAPSDEKTRMVAESLPVRYVREPRPGLDFARNRAIEECRGEILAFIDDDAVADRWWLSGLQKASIENPDAGGFTGPVVPYELATRAQILFELRGGFGHEFKRRRFGPECCSIRNYPCNSGVIGTGCNMAFRRDVLVRLGGFDEALDTGAPLPGGGDLDIFYRTLRAGYPMVYEPQLVVFHQHRRSHRDLRHQMYTWGLGIMAHAVKNYRSDPALRSRFRCMILGWFRTLAGMAIGSIRNGREWAPDLALAEIRGGFVGLFGEYDRSRRRIELIRKRYPG
jgi:GT2 family glycosyltransferase